MAIGIKILGYTGIIISIFLYMNAPLGRGTTYYLEKCTNELVKIRDATPSYSEDTLVPVPIMIISVLEKHKKQYAAFTLRSRDFNLLCIIILFVFSISCIILGNNKKIINK